MELEWEQGRTSTRSSLAVPGAILGAALGADCLLAMSRFGDIPTVLCGAAIVLFAVRGGALTAGRGGRTRTLLALPWVLLFDCLGHHLCFALESAPGDPAGIWQAFLSLSPCLSGTGCGWRLWRRCPWLPGRCCSTVPGGNGLC